MEIPNSIAAITEERVGDMFLQREAIQSVNIDDIIFAVKQKLDTNLTKHFTTGIATPKTVYDYRSLLKGILQVYASTIQQAIKTSSIPDEQRDIAASSIATVVKNMVDSFDAFCAVVDSLNKNKKIIDVQEISFIIIGYAIDAIRKIHNTTTQ